MIRLGSLAGYPFEGPRLLAGWTAPELAAVYAVMYRTDPDREEFGVVYVGHAKDLSSEKFPFKHPAAPCWLERVEGDRFRLYIGFYEVPGGTAAHREQISRELIAVYRPGCNSEQYDQAWKDTWIGAYKAPTTKPLTTDRDPSGRRAKPS